MSMSTRLTKNLYGKIAKDAPVLTDSVSKETAEAILADAKATVHVITGATRDSGEVVKTGIGYDVTFSAGAIYEEYGTVHREAHPFLTPASERAKSGYIEKLRQGLSL